MNKPVVVLTLTAIALAGAGAYLLRRIDAERARTPAMAELPAVPALSDPAAAPPVSQDATSGNAAAPAAANAATETPRADARLPAAAPPEDRRARNRRQAAEYLERYQDPAQRAALRKDEVTAARRSTAGAAERLKLAPEQYEKLVQLLADMSFERRVAAARCLVDWSCVSPTKTEAYVTLDRQVGELIGESGRNELRKLGRTDMERRAVNSLQSRLSAIDALSPEQADQLAAALLDEERRLDRAMRDQHRIGFASSDGPSLSYTDRAESLELMLQSGEAHVQALRDRAATQLSGAQLAALDEMYDDLLIEFRRHLRIKAAGR